MQKQRDIRFRAWDPLDKEMYAVTSLKDDGTCEILGDALSRVWRPPVQGMEPEAVLMQFTGLTDKNGKEIWEGDIVKDFISNRTGIIKFNHGMFVVTYEEIKNWKPANRGGHSGNLEVIGNIYENPELLKA